MALALEVERCDAHMGTCAIEALREMRSVGNAGRGRGQRTQKAPRDPARTPASLLQLTYYHQSREYFAAHHVTSRRRNTSRASHPRPEDAGGGPGAGSTLSLCDLDSWLLLLSTSTAVVTGHSLGERAAHVLYSHNGFAYPVIASLSPAS